MKKDVVKDEVLKEKIIDEKVLKCYYSICKYYNKKNNLVQKFILKSCRKSCQ